MITREEFAILQHQMVSLSDERLDLHAQVTALQASNCQIPILRQQIIETRSLRDREERAILAKIEKVQSSVSAVTTELRNGGDGNWKTNWNEDKLSRLESQMESAVSQSVTLDEVVVRLSAEAAEIEVVTSALDSSIAKAATTFDGYRKITSAVGSFGALSMRVVEAESALASTRRRVLKGSCRIEKRIAQVDELTAATTALRVELEEAGATIISLKTATRTATEESAVSERALAEVSEELELLEREATACEKEADKETRVTLDGVNQCSSERSASAAALADVDRCVEALVKAQEEQKLERDIRVNKKTTMVGQLNKSIKEKISDVVREYNNSPHVRRLIEAQENQWVERQEIYEMYTMVKERHDEVTAAMERKAVVLAEMRASAKEGVGADPMTELGKAFDAASAEYKAAAAGLVALKRELEAVEAENADMKQLTEK